ncbi:MAG: zinc-ribbon domain-containing protein [Treponema sp.]|jgi:hypothetical protein|nr:zinc-ribbon domain-containing protein [Treponema sp.]
MGLLRNLVGAYQESVKNALDVYNNISAEQAEDAEGAWSFDAALPEDCDDPAALLAENDGYKAIEIGEFAALYENESYTSGTRFKSAATVSHKGMSSLSFYTSDTRSDNETSDDFKYSIPLPALEEGDDVIIFYKTKKGARSRVEKLVKLSPLASGAWRESRAAAQIPPPRVAGRNALAGSRGARSAPASKPAAAFCTNCGAKIEDGAKFCVGCGTKIG